MSISGIARTVAPTLHVQAQVAQVTPEMVPLAVSPPMMLAPVVLTVIAVAAANLLFACTALAALEGKLLLTVSPVLPLPIVAVAFASTVGVGTFRTSVAAGLSTRPT